MGRKEKKERMLLAQRHLGIIAQAAYKAWQRLPVCVLASMDVEDMIASAVLRVTEVALKYDGHTKESTFVWCVAHNHCSLVVSRYTKVKKRQAGFPIPEEYLSRCSRPDATQKFLESKYGFERLLQFSSDDVQQYLWDFLSTRRYRWNGRAIREIKKLAREHDVSHADFQRVLRCV